MRFSSHKLFARAANYRSILASVAPNASAQTPRHASLCASAPPLALRWHARGRLAAQIPIAERAARPTERTLPRFRALAAFRTPVTGARGYGGSAAMAARCSPGSQLRRVIKHLREELRLSMPLAGA